VLPASDAPLGDLSARCAESCSTFSLRRSVLIAAGRLGAKDVIGMRCAKLDGADVCVGTLAAPERLD
jgi:hypothetical protein